MKPFVATSILMSLLLTAYIPVANAVTPAPAQSTAKQPTVTIQDVEELNGQSYVLKSGKVYVGKSTTPLAIPVKVKDLIPGEKFMVFLTDDKKVYFQGTLYDQSDMTYFQKPVLTSVKPVSLPITSVEKVMTGRNEILFLTTNRDLYVMGANNLNQLGIQNAKKVSKPTRLLANVRSAATSANTTVIIADHGIYVCGYKGQQPASYSLQKIAETGNYQHVFALDKSLNRSIYQKNAQPALFYLPTAEGGSVISTQSITKLDLLTDPMFANSVGYKTTPYTDFLYKANGEIWVRYAYRARGRILISDTKGFDFDGFLYTSYEKLASNASSAGIHGKTLYAFGKGAVQTKPYPTQAELIERIKKDNQNITSLSFNKEEGVFLFEDITFSTQP
ncbi:hypothetical protein [Brevibacillus sp. SYSU BS000544]|uniref:hypothetical protein n=1 Tax=Brevibacillus sp. SYSU BS000544 TaxID=3416443 RepID=UPI003CE57FB6